MVDYPKDWEEIVIEDLFIVTRGQVLATDNIKMKKSSNYKYPVYSSQTKNKGLLGYYFDYLFEDAITWTTDGANAGDTNYRQGKFYCTNVCGVLLNEEGYANQCIAAILNSVSKSYVSYVGNPKLMNNVVKKIKITIPTLYEQKIISETLSIIDNHIENLEKLIEKKKMIRDGAVENLMSGKKRLDGFDGEWRKMQLNQFAEINPYGIVPNEFYYVDLESVKGKKLIDKKRYTKLTSPSRAQRFANYGDIFFQTVRPYQRNNYLFKNKYDNYVFSSGYAQLRTQNSSEFLFQLIFTDSFVNQVLDNCTGTSYPAISPRALGDILINIPDDIKEQEAIASILTSMDNEIENLEREKEKIEKIKQGAMDDLLTGKVRLI